MNHIWNFKKDKICLNGFLHVLQDLNAYPACRHELLVEAMQISEMPIPLVINVYCIFSRKNVLFLDLIYLKD